MAKKKLKLKSVKDIKESVKEEKEKIQTDKKEKKAKKKKDPKKRKRIGNIIGISLITIGIGLASICIAFCLYIVFTSPEFSTEKLYNQEASVIYWKDGTEMTRLGDENRELKNYEDFPQVLVDALVATEDSRFFQHRGFDAARFFVASLGQLAGNSDAGGASTLSMQLAKNKFNGDDATGITGIIRKFKDIYMAVFKIEKNYTKEQIIEMYLNSWWFAGGGTNSGGTYGVEQASQYFFGKSVSDLSLPECALLVGMANNAVVYNPYTYPENANDRKNTVLSLMNRHGYITEQEMKDAQSIDVRSLVVAQTNTSESFAYQSLVDYVVEEIQDKEGINIRNQSYEVYTTFDKNIQDIVNAMQNGDAVTWRDDKVQVAAAVTSVSDGSITALGPGRNYVALGNNRASGEGFRMQPGSTAKPLVDYGPLIEYNNASSGQMFIDFRYTYNDGTVVNNWDNSYEGVMTMKNALAASRNTTALQAFHQVDPKNIETFLNNLGIDEDNYGEEGILQSMSIGGFQHGLTPLESSAAYAAFSRGGYYIEPYSYYRLVNTQTEETTEYKYEMVKAMSEETAYMITDILMQATRDGVGGNINSSLRGSIASKSGTTNVDSATAEQKGISVYATPDHWVNTYNTEYAISMWYGYDKKDLDSEHYLTSSTGSGTRGQISAYLANRILTNTTKFEKPDSVVSVTVEANTLPTKKASEYTPDNMKYTALFKEGTEPSETSTRYAKLDNASNGDSSASDNTISLSWDAAPTPDALNSDAVKTEFSNYFSNWKKNYSYSYQLFETEYMRIYNNTLTSSIGTLGYQVYLKDSNGNLTSLGWTQDTNYKYTAPTGGDYTFVIKTAYSIFKTNQSDGIEIKATVENTGPGLEATASIICVEQGSTFNAKNAVTVTYNKEDVTSSATITASNVDTSTTGTKDVTYSIRYNGEQIQIKGKVNVSTSCSTTPPGEGDGGESGEQP